jgi:hypothetical protein
MLVKKVEICREVNMFLGTPPRTKMVSVSLALEPRGQVW